MSGQILIRSCQFMKGLRSPRDDFEIASQVFYQAKAGTVEAKRVDLGRWVEAKRADLGRWKENRPGIFAHVVFR